MARRPSKSAPPPPAPLTAFGRRALRLPLVLGVLALAVTLSVPATQYMGLAESSASSGSAEGDLPPTSTTLPVRVLGLETGGRIPDAADAERLDATRARIATNILLRSGYLTGAYLQTDAATGRTTYSVQLQPEIAACAAPRSARAADVAPAEPVRRGLEASRVQSLAVAVVAVEKFNRNLVQRGLEWGLARSALQLFGRLPDLSLGAAQIRPSTVRRLLASGVAVGDWQSLALDEQALAAALADECQSLGLAADLIRMEACTDCEAPAARAVMAYGGQRRRTGATMDYTAVVLAVAAMLD